MSNKSILFDALQTVPTSIGDAAFPSLSVPSSPSTVQDAIIASAKANIEVVKFLNSFSGFKIKELFGMVGMLSPSALAIASGFLQSDGTALAPGTIPQIIKVLGDEASGGGITGNIESPTRREGTGTGLSLLEEAISCVPALADYAAYLTPILNVAIAIYEKPGRIAEQIGLILFEEVVTLIRQIIINELYSHDDDESHIDQSALRNIADSLKTIADTEGIIEIDGARIWTRSKIVDGE